jgi:hypothetical protein
LLALRITQLGDAAVTIPWDRQLRNIWAYKFKQLTEEQRQDPNIAHDLTSWQLSAHSVLTLMGQDDDRAMAVAQDTADPPTLPSGTVDHALNPSNSNSSRHSNGHGKPSASRAPQTQPTQARRDRISPTQGHGCAFALRCRKTPTRRCFTAPSTPSATSEHRGSYCNPYAVTGCESLPANRGLSRINRGKSMRNPASTRRPLAQNLAPCSRLGAPSIQHLDRQGDCLGMHGFRCQDCRSQRQQLVGRKPCR